ncbi:MAG: HAD-IIIA family hydrolase [Patescibacteria group bacterium]|nr:HAD-IIIA family hydrolase [Patescibacteria group bacterium]
MKRIRQAVVLAGGQGTRLQPLTLTTPKPLIPIHGKPFAEYLVELLKKNGIEEIIFLTGYLAEQFPATLGDGSRWSLTIRYNQTPVEDETGERLCKAAHLLDDDFLLMYGDNYWPLNLSKLLAHHERMGTLATVTAYDRPSTDSKNNMRIEDGMVRMYDKTKKAEGLNAVDIGFLILSKKILEMIPEGNLNFEKTMYPALVAGRKLAGFLTCQPYWSLTSIERFPAIERALKSSRKVLFLDRDGTINKKAPLAEYVPNWSVFEFLPGALDALEELAKRGYEFYIISNQPGIARGMVKEEDLRDIHQRMQEALKKRGVTISGIYYCPHGWDEGCDCRKPNPEMLYQAAREHDIDLTRAYFVGDDERDKEAGDAAGVQTILVPEGIGLAAALPQLP